MRALLALLLLALPAACISPNQAEEPYWHHEELVDGPPMRDLMHASMLAMMRADFPPGELDQVGGVATSGWDVNLSPYSERGTRSQAIIEVVRGDEPRSYKLSARVRTQGNREIHKTLDADAAKWEDRNEDRARAQVVMRQLLIQVAPRSGRGGRLRQAPPSEQR